MNIVITADKDKGKTTLCIKLSSLLKLNRYSVKGFLCPNNKILNVENAKELVFLRQTEIKESIKVGKYFITKKGLDFGIKSLKTLKKNDFVFIDQFWKLELQKKGFFRAIKNTLGKANLIIIVRKAVLEQFLETFPHYCFKIFEITENRIELPRKIISYIKQNV